ncbi:MAG: hypothetical protein PUA56_06345 [Bacillales bacterium]|nr:hypothetical protein [Bacillales bacterium]
MKKSNLFILSVAALLSLGVIVGCGPSKTPSDTTSNNTTAQQTTSSKPTSSKPTSEKPSSAPTSTTPVHNHQFTDVTNGEEGFKVYACAEDGKTYLETDSKKEGKWDKNTDYAYTFAVGAATKGKLTIMAQLSNADHTNRSFYVDPSIGGSDDVENAAENAGKCRLEVKVGEVACEVTKLSYGDLGLNAESLVEIELADVNLLEGVNTVTISTKGFGYRLILGGKVRVYVDSYTKYVVPPHVHTYGDVYTMVTKPTLTATGTATHACIADDGATEEVTVPALTDAVWTKETVTPATHAAEGQDKYTSIYGEVLVTVEKDANHTFAEVTTDEDGFKVFKCSEDNATYLSKESLVKNAKWSKGATYNYNVAVGADTVCKLTIMAKLSSADHANRSFYVDSSIPGSSGSESAENEGKCRLTVKVGDVACEVTKLSYGDLGLNVSDYVEIELANVNLLKGVNDVSITTDANLGYSLYLDGEVRVYVDSYTKYIPPSKAEKFTVGYAGAVTEEKAKALLSTYRSYAKTVGVELPENDDVVAIAGENDTAIAEAVANRSDVDVVLGTSGALTAETVLANGTMPSLSAGYAVLSDGDNATIKDSFVTFVKAYTSTDAAPLSIEEAVAITTPFTSGVTPFEFTVTGTVTEITYSTQYNNYTIWLGNKAFEIYGGVMADGVTVPVVGDTITARGASKQYNTTSEFYFYTVDGVKVYPKVTSVTHKSYAISVASTIENGTVSVDKTIANSGDTVTITVTPAKDYIVDKVLVNGKAIEAVDGVYSFIVTGSAEVSATFVAFGTPIAAEIYSQNFDSADFVATTSYDNSNPKAFGPEADQWIIVGGSVSTTKPIEGAKSVLMRFYTSQQYQNYLMSSFAFKNATEVSFKALALAKVQVVVEKSADGKTWTAGETFTPSTSAKEFTYTISSTGETVYLRFSLTVLEGAATKSDLKIDSIVVKGFSAE